MVRSADAVIRRCLCSSAGAVLAAATLFLLRRRRRQGQQQLGKDVFDPEAKLQPYPPSLMYSFTRTNTDLGPPGSGLDSASDVHSTHFKSHGGRRRSVSRRGGLAESVLLSGTREVWAGAHAQGSDLAFLLVSSFMACLQTLSPHHGCFKYSVVTDGVLAV